MEKEEKDEELTYEDYYSAYLYKGALTVPTQPIHKDNSEDELITVYKVENLDHMHGITRRIIGAGASFRIAREKINILGIKIERNLIETLQGKCFETNKTLKGLDRRIDTRKCKISALKTVRSVLIASGTKEAAQMSMTEPKQIRFIYW